MNTVYNTVEAYNKNLVKSTATAIRVKTNEAVGSYVGNYASVSYTHLDVYKRQVYRDIKDILYKETRVAFIEYGEVR